MRIGEVLANDGVFEGNQLTPPRYVSLMLKPTYPDSTMGFFTRVGGTFAARDVAWLESDGQATVVDSAVTAPRRSCAWETNRRIAGLG